MLILIVDGGGIFYEIALSWLPLNFNDDKSTLVQVMAWCRQATSHYLNQCWPRSLLPYGITWPQWVKLTNEHDTQDCTKRQYTYNKCPIAHLSWASYGVYIVSVLGQNGYHYTYIIFWCTCFPQVRCWLCVIWPELNCTPVNLAWVSLDLAFNTSTQKVLCCKRYQYISESYCSVNLLCH